MFLRGPVPKAAGFILALALCVSAFSGCAIFAIGVDSVKQAGFTEGDRQQLLGKAVKEFHEVLFFGRVDAAMKHVDDDLRVTLAPKFSKQFKNEKMVEHSIDGTQFSPNSFEATVEVTVKVFRNTDYLVKDRELVEKWKFTLGGDWLLASYEEKEAGHA